MRTRTLYPTDCDCNPLDTLTMSMPISVRDNRGITTNGYGTPIQVQPGPPAPPASDRRGEGVVFDASLPTSQETKSSLKFYKIETGKLNN